MAIAELCLQMRLFHDPISSYFKDSIEYICHHLEHADEVAPLKRGNWPVSAGADDVHIFMNGIYTMPGSPNRLGASLTQSYKYLQINNEIGSISVRSSVLGQQQQ